MLLLDTRLILITIFFTFVLSICLYWLFILLRILFPLIDIFRRLILSPSPLFIINNKLFLLIHIRSNRIRLIYIKLIILNLIHLRIHKLSIRKRRRIRILTNHRIWIRVLLQSRAFSHLSSNIIFR